MSYLTHDFDSDEFTCKCGCGLNNISRDFVDVLQHSRSAVAVPYIIRSGSRCEAHNAAEGGEKSSAHLKGLAADIECPDSHTRYLMLFDFCRRFHRVGIGRTFIHVDLDRSLPQEVTWLY